MTMSVHHLFETFRCSVSIGASPFRSTGDDVPADFANETWIEIGGLIGIRRTERPRTSLIECKPNDADEGQRALGAAVEAKEFRAVRIAFDASYTHKATERYLVAEIMSLEQNQADGTPAVLQATIEVCSTIVRAAA